MPELVETIVVGGGQAGLAISYHLAQRNREHVIFERGRVAERWCSERWESLVFQFPNRMLRLPGYSYTGDEPEAFMGREGVTRFISDYAARISAPLRCGINVTSLRQNDCGRLTVQAGETTMEAANVVVATGPYQLPSIPRCSASLPFSVHQVTANRYTRPSDLPPGNVLVVGSGGSGCQIAEDLREAGRGVFYAVRKHRRMPRHYRGQDLGWWLERSGMTEYTREGMPLDWRNSRAPLMTGVRGGRTVDLRQLAREGITLLGSLLDAVDGHLHFAADLNANLKAGDESFVHFVRTIDGLIERTGLCAPPEEGFDPYLRETPEVLREISVLDLRASNITTVVWATGYRYDFGWIDCPVFDERGLPMQQRGVTATAGVFFLGLPRMYKVKSAFLWGVGEDAEFLAQQIEHRSDVS
jgi:putative flavoprotein involved in K+ transport